MQTVSITGQDRSTDGRLTTSAAMKTTALRYGDWALRGLLVTLFTLAGAMKLTAHSVELHSFAHFGYEAWFMHAIGLIEFGAAFASCMRG